MILRDILARFTHGYTSVYILISQYIGNKLQNSHFYENLRIFYQMMRTMYAIWISFKIFTVLTNASQCRNVSFWVKASTKVSSRKS